MIHRIFNTWIVESSTGILLTLQVFADTAYFADSTNDQMYIQEFSTALNR